MVSQLCHTQTNLADVYYSCSRYQRAPQRKAIATFLPLIYDFGSFLYRIYYHNQALKMHDADREERGYAEQRYVSAVKRST
jgi:hypothetical protein